MNAKLALGLLLLLPTVAQALPLDSASGKEPIEINADQLEVVEAENQAIFTGNVVAIQGDTRLKSDRMVVYYEGKAGDAPKPAAKPEGAQEARSIQKIDVEGNVFLSTPTDTAQGARGTYDVAAKMIRLFENVTLTSKDNVLRGNELEHNMLTGRSVMKSAGVSGKERVKGLFVPSKKEDVPAGAGR